MTSTALPAAGGRRYEGAGVTVAPAPEGRVAQVSASEVVASVQARYGGLLGAATPHAELMLATDGDFGDSPAGSQSFEDRLAWVVTYAGTKAHPLGGLTMTPERRDAIAAALDCETVFVVDARTGEVLAFFQTCGPAGKVSGRGG